MATPQDDQAEQALPLGLIPPGATWTPRLEASITQAMATGGRWACHALAAADGDCEAAFNMLVSRLVADDRALALAAVLAAQGLLNGVLFAAEKEREASH